MNNITNYRPRILIVEDVPENIQILAEILKETGEICFATNGKRALELAGQEHGPDIILLDLVMPDISGIDICKTLKENGSTADIPIIFVTGQNQEWNETRGLIAGAVDYITKPVKPEIVKARVNTHLKLRHHAKALTMQNEILKENTRLREEVELITRHDIKGPLMALLNIPELLKMDENLRKDQLELLVTMEKAGKRILQMINDSLDLAKIERKTYELKLEKISLIPAIKQVLSELKPLSEVKGITSTISSGLENKNVENEIMVMAEEPLIFSIFSNLLKNAIEAAPGGSKVEITIEDSDPIKVCVHNQGSIPESIQKSFFEKFTTQGKKKGTGLGTYSAKIMTEVLGGEISFQSSEQEGTRLFLKLPAGKKMKTTGTKSPKNFKP